MVIFVWVDLQTKNEEKDHKHPNVRVLLKHIVNFILLMNKKLVKQKTIIVVIPIINNINVGHPGQERFHWQEILVHRISHRTHDTNEKNLTLEDRHQDINERNLPLDQVERIHHHKDDIDESELLNIDKLCYYISFFIEIKNSTIFVELFYLFLLFEYFP